MKFRCAGVSDSMIDGIGISLDVFFQGCSLHCFGCHNPELQDFTGGFDYDTNEIVDITNQHIGFYDSVCLTGGDPLEQIDPLYDIISKSTLPVVLYTGRTYDEIPEFVRSRVSVVVDGQYREDLRTNGFPASANQKIYCTAKIKEKFMRNKR